MSDLLGRFRSVGENVRIAPDVFIAHPEEMDVGSNVTFERGVHIEASLRECRIGDNVTFKAYTVVTGTGRLLIDDHVGFYVNTCIELGRETDDGVLSVGHHTHFAPGCLLYGNGGLDIGPTATSRRTRCLRRLATTIASPIRRWRCCRTGLVRSVWSAMCGSARTRP